MTKKTNAYIKGESERTLLLAVHAPYNYSDFEPYKEEFINLAKTNGIESEHILSIKLRSINPPYFLTTGKLEELLEYCNTHEIKRVIISEQLTANQERNLSEFLNCSIVDRTLLILEIFEKSALSAEGKTQVEMAMLRYQKSRLAGRGIHMSQQQGGFGRIGGFGETAKEKETRHIENAILKLQKQLDRIQQSRHTQRKQRLINQEPHICLVGYTNAGKSTVLNSLTHSNVLAEDKLFATLDTTTRQLYLNGTKKGLISDTVGFIQQLPHNLIEAFKSTLSELHYADLLLHIIDVSDKNWPIHIRVTLETLHEIGIEKDMLFVFNKADLLSDEELEKIDEYIAKYQPHVLISAEDDEGIEPLKEFLIAWNAKKTD